MVVSAIAFCFELALGCVTLLMKAMEGLVLRGAPRAACLWVVPQHLQEAEACGGRWLVRTPRRHWAISELHLAGHGPPHPPLLGREVSQAPRCSDERRSCPEPAGA